MIQLLNKEFVMGIVEILVVVLSILVVAAVFGEVPKKQSGSNSAKHADDDENPFLSPSHSGTIGNVFHDDN